MFVARAYKVNLVSPFKHCRNAKPHSGSTPKMEFYVVLLALQLQILVGVPKVSVS
jgi:hypothetical protein